MRAWRCHDCGCRPCECPPVRHPRVYTQVKHNGAVIVVGGKEWVIDSVDVYEGDEGYDWEAEAHLSLLPVMTDEDAYWADKDNE